MILRYIVGAVVLSFVAVAQSTFLQSLAPWGAIPDFALILLVFLSWRYGSTYGQTVGFLAGLAIDSVSLSPWGFHAFLFAFAGFLIGLLSGRIAPGRILLPAGALLAATIYKRGLGRLLALVFSLPFAEGRLFTTGFAMELGLNVVLAPLVFLIADGILGLTAPRRGGFR